MIDDLLLWKFDLETANCFDHARASWKRITGCDLPPRSTVVSMDDAGADVAARLPAYTKLDSPQDPCIVILDRPSLPGRCPHVGVLFRGRLLHATSDGAYHEPLGTAAQRLGASRICYYLPPE